MLRSHAEECAQTCGSTFARAGNSKIRAHAGIPTVSSKRWLDALKADCVPCVWVRSKRLKLCSIVGQKNTDCLRRLPEHLPYHLLTQALVREPVGAIHRPENIAIGQRGSGRPGVDRHLPSSALALCERARAFQRGPQCTSDRHAVGHG